MKKTLLLLSQGFESSCGTTKEFLNFVKTFRSELTKELKSIGATNIKIGKGHFYVSGFFTSASGQIYYISLSDVRGSEFQSTHKMMFRTATSYTDYTGGSNQWVTIESGMAERMYIK